MDTIKNITTVDSNLLSEYILERGGIMSHLKLQKILFFVQAYHLAYFDVEIIADDFEAWIHGPVSRKVFNELKDKSLIYADLAFALKDDKDLPSITLPQLLTQDQIELVNDVIDEFKAKTGGELESITHSEQPWINARKGIAPCDKCSTIISKDEIRVFYKQYLA